MSSTFYSVSNPFRDLEQLETIERFLKENDPFVHAAFSLDTSKYQLRDYLQYSHNPGPPIYAVLDRNIISRVVKVGSGGSLDVENNTDRLTMAVMAFLCAANIEVEPNIALYEVTATQENNNVRSELAAVRIANELHPTTYAEIAFGESKHASRFELRKARKKIKYMSLNSAKFERFLPHWEMHHLALTKIAVLARQNKNPEECLRELFRWSLEDAFFDGIAVSLGVVLLGSKGGRSLVMRAVRSSDPDKRIAVVANATWDLTYASYWVKRTKQFNGPCLFVTADKRLRALCRLAIGNHSHQELFRDYWPAPHAKELLRAYNDVEAIARDMPRRRDYYSTDAWKQKMHEMQRELTKQLRDIVSD
ncbi:hypothetical protein DFR33_104286 [Bradymonas sediminis]|nr:hypothetical protein DFR33_104286 [Bradymonas sediminis]